MPAPGPHHDVGFTDDMQQRQMECKHHGDELVPRQQQLGQYTRLADEGLEVPVLNQFGLGLPSCRDRSDRAPSPSTRISTSWVCWME